MNGRLRPYGVAVARLRDSNQHKAVEGKADRENNVLRNAPHTARLTTDDGWAHPYTRSKAAYPASWVRERKFWPPVARIDNAWGDRNLICTCDPVEAYAFEPAVKESK